MAESGLVEGYLTQVVPSAIITDGLVPVPLYSVSAMTLSETYHLPPIGSSGTRALVATHDDTITLSGVLVGKERYAWKFALETLAESGMRGGGGLVAGLSLLGMNISGVILLTALTIRTDMQITALSISASSAKRQTLDVSLTLVHVPKPGAVNKLLDIASLGLSSLSGW
jgi:hypothetical protein